MNRNEIKEDNEKVNLNNKAIEKQKERSSPIVENMFDSQKEFVVLGLCGKTGSGVSTVSNILNSRFCDLRLPDPCEESQANIKKTEYRLLYNFARENWKEFYKIKTSSLILSKAIFSERMEFSDYLQNFAGKSSRNDNNTIRSIIDKEINKLYDAELSFYVGSTKIDETLHEFGKTEVDELIKFVEERIGRKDLFVENDIIKIKVSEVNKIFYEYKEARLKKDSFGDYLIYEILYRYVYEKLPMLAGRFWSNLSDKLKLNMKTVALQDMGNNLRITKDNPFIKEPFTEDGFSGIAELINISIKLLRDYKYKKVSLFIEKKSNEILNEEKRAFVVIDSIKNPYESMYLKKRYSNYYLIAVYTDEKNRKERLEQNEHLEQKDIQAIDITEQLSEFKKIQKKYKKWIKDNPKDNELLNSKECNEAVSEAIERMNSQVFDNNERLKEIVKGMVNLYADATYPFIMQNIQDCIESADIFINNKDESSSYLNLKKKLLRYVSLIMYPGLVLPTSVERCMQIAYTSKLCSGCISRQVGAVLTNSKFNLMAIGWNQQPENQVPCLYRSIDEVRNHCNQEAYSDYENDDKKSFQDSIKKPVDDYYQTEACDVIKRGRSISYCFKDIYNEITNDKNQIHPRSLHAEETAFLNLNRTGADSIKGGFLFTTSSPCELCSKKAMYMGIKKIFYVQPYPGISNEHVLSAGYGEERPKLELYTGAIGRAYTQLYTPLIPKKDELELWMGHKVSINNYIKKEMPIDEEDSNGTK